MITETSGDIPDSADNSPKSPSRNLAPEDGEPQASRPNTPEDPRRKRADARHRREEAQKSREEQQAAKLAAAKARKGKGHGSTDAGKEAGLKKKEYERRRRDHERERRVRERQEQGREEEEEEEEESDDEAELTSVKLIDLNMSTPVPRFVNQLTVLRSTMIESAAQEGQVNPPIGHGQHA